MSAAPEPASSPSRDRLLTAACLLLPLVAGVILAAADIANPIWYDEAYTLEQYATGQLSDAFTTYDAPNNHVLFSALLSLWKTWVVPGTPEIPYYLRPLPILLYAASVLVLTLAAWRMAGRRAALIAGLLFATSHVTLNYAAQLRGYGFSWLPVAGAIWLTWLDARRPRRWTLGGVVLLAGVAVGIVPTNALVIGILAAWRILLDGPRRPRAGRLVRYAVFLAAPLAALPVYLPNAAAFIETLRGHETAFTATGNAGEWWRATMIDLWWLWPVLAVGVALAGLRALRAGEAAPDRTPEPSAAAFHLLLASAVLPLLAWWALPNVPYPRTLVPLLPVWFLAWGLLAADALQVLRAMTGRTTAFVAAALIAVLLVVTAVRREATNARYVERFAPGEKPFDLYDQYPLDPRFDPDAAARWVRAQAMARPVFVLIDDTDLWGIRHALTFFPTDPQFRIGYYRIRGGGERFAEVAAGRLVLLLTRNPAEARGMMRHLELPGRMTPALYDGGFFRVYAVVPEWEDGEEEPPGTPAEPTAGDGQ